MRLHSHAPQFPCTQFCRDINTPRVDTYKETPEPYSCPTACDDDCHFCCHEQHQPMHKRTHDAVACTAHVVADKRSGLMVGLARAESRESVEPKKHY